MIAQPVVPAAKPLNSWFGQRHNSMSSILDIDLDYFNLVEQPAERLSQMLAWADCPVSFVVENHHESLHRWKSYVRKGKLREPQYILHVDEHHDMMDERRTPNIANFIYHAMRIWVQARVHWLVEESIDSPEMWLSEDTWQTLSKRFTMGINIPREWPKPQLVSICTSPEFVDLQRRNELIAVVEKSKMPNNKFKPTPGTALAYERAPGGPA